jgi:YesN/AraC family two-component response regulator
MDKWIDICRKHIADQIRDLENGRFNLRVPAISVKAKYTSNMHYHTTPEMSLQISGSHVINFPTQSFQIVPGVICVIPAMLSHFGSRIENERSLFMVIAFEHVELSFLKGEVKCGGTPHVTEVLMIKTKHKDNIKNYMNYLCDIYKTKHGASESALRGILLACFSELLMILDEDEVTENYNSHPKILKTLNLITANLGDVRLNVDFLSKLIPCSPTYLSQLFRRKIGIKLSTYINEQRVKYSKKLLKETNINIAEVAYSCGYADPSYFIYVFRKQTRMTPLEYKKH